MTVTTGDDEQPDRRANIERMQARVARASEKAARLNRLVERSEDMKRVRVQLDMVARTVERSNASPDALQRSLDSFRDSVGRQLVSDPEWVASVNVLRSVTVTGRGRARRGTAAVTIVTEPAEIDTVDITDVVDVEVKRTLGLPDEWTAGLTPTRISVLLAVWAALRDYVQDLLDDPSATATSTASALCFVLAWLLVSEAFKSSDD